MLASTLSPEKLPAQVMIQPKYDGMRCVASRDSMLSRRGMPIDSMPHIRRDLSELPSGIKLDGELYCHGVNFQGNMSLIKRNSPHPDFYSVKYYVFDLQIENIPFKTRFALLTTLLSDLDSATILLVPTLTLDKENIYTHTKTHFSDYEGAIIRDPDGLYLFNHRSSGVQKYKWLHQVECQIVSITTSTTGREAGAVLFICELNGVRFEVRPFGSLLHRRSLYHHAKNLIGQWTRITYESLSNAGKPLKARAEGIASTPTGLQ